MTVVEMPLSGASDAPNNAIASGIAGLVPTRARSVVATENGQHSMATVRKVGGRVGPTYLTKARPAPPLASDISAKTAVVAALGQFSSAVRCGRPAINSPYPRPIT